MRIERPNQPQRVEVMRYRQPRQLAQSPEEAVYRMLFPGRNYEARTNEQMDEVQAWIEKNSPGWNSKE